MKQILSLINRCYFWSWTVSWGSTLALRTQFGRMQYHLDPWEDIVSTDSWGHISKCLTCFLHHAWLCELEGQGAWYSSLGMMKEYARTISSLKDSVCFNEYLWCKKFWWHNIIYWFTCVKCSINFISMSIFDLKVLQICFLCQNVPMVFRFKIALIFIKALEGSIFSICWQFGSGQIRWEILIVSGNIHGNSRLLCWCYSCGTC